MTPVDLALAILILVESDPCPITKSDSSTKSPYNLSNLQSAESNANQCKNKPFQIFGAQRDSPVHSGA